jgi:MATE family multidrug resistance protein
MNPRRISHDTVREGGIILSIAMPLTAAYMAEMGMIIIDMIMVGHLGSVELAAVGLAGDLFWVFLLVGMGVISMVGVLVAQAFGARQYQAMVDAAEQGMIVAMLASLPIVICVWFLGPALGLARQEPQVVIQAQGYSRMLALGVMPALWFVVMRNFITALAHSAAIGWIMSGALCLNVAINYTLIFGKFGLPALGVAGAGIGTSIVNWSMFLSLALYIRHSRHFARYRPRLFPRRVQLTTVREIVRLGLPVGLTQILNAGMFSAAAVLAGIVSAKTLAAQQILYSVIYLALSFAAGFADAVRVRVAYGLGQRDLSVIRRSARLSLTMVSLAAFGASMTIWLIPELLVGIFLDQEQAANRDVMGIALALGVSAGLFLVIDSAQMVLADALRGLRDTRGPLAISLAGYWITGLGTGSFMCFVLDMGIQGLWWGLVGGVLLCCLLLYRRLRVRIASGLPGAAP